MFPIFYSLVIPFFHSQDFVKEKVREAKKANREVYSKHVESNGFLAVFFFFFFLSHAC